MFTLQLRYVVVLSVGLSCSVPKLCAEEVKVVHQQGSAHGFVEVTTVDGKRIAVGDLLQRAHGSMVSSRLIMRFFDGSVDDETTVFSQRGVFRFVSDRHIQRGPSFPKPSDVTIDARKGEVTTVDASGHSKTSHIDMPPDTYNGLASTLLMNMPPAMPETKVAIVVAGDKPRIVHLSMKSAGEVAFTIGGTPRKAIDYVAHVEIPGLAGVVAPLIGKEPLDYHVLILAGPDPAFIREEGQLFEGGPIWRIQQISALIPEGTAR